MDTNASGRQALCSPTPTIIIVVSFAPSQMGCESCPPPPLQMPVQVDASMLEGKKGIYVDLVLTANKIHWTFFFWFLLVLILSDRLPLAGDICSSSHHPVSGYTFPLPLFLLIHQGWKSQLLASPFPSIKRLKIVAHVDARDQTQVIQELTFKILENDEGRPA